MRLRSSLEISLGFCAVLFVCCALRREALYGDGGALMTYSVQGKLEYQGHRLYLPAVAGLEKALAPLSLRLFELMSLASALGTALGIAGMHAAALALGLPRGRAALVAALAFATPAVVFFGCVIEIHGVFMASVGWACCLAARLATRGTAMRAVALGAMTGIAALVHLTGLMLPLCLLPLVFAWRRERKTLVAMRFVRDGALVVGAHLLVFKAIAWGLQPDRAASFAATLGYLLSGLERLRISALPTSLWDELGHAFLPISLAWVVAFARPALRTQAVATAAIVASYAAVPFVLLGSTIDEHGAYLVPVAFPLALLVVSATPPKACVPLVLAGFLFALVQLSAHDAKAKDWPDAQAVAEFTQKGRRALICVTTNELDPVFKHEPRTVPLALDLLLQQGLPDRQLTAQFAMSEASFRASGMEVVLTDHALVALRTDPQHRLTALLAEIEGKHELVRLQVGTLVGWRLVPR